MRRSNDKKKFVVMLFLLLVVGLGIGYALLTQQLNINNTVSYDPMRWDIGFEESEDLGGSIVSTSSISSDKKTLTVNCDFGSSVTQESCVVKATILNDSTFDIMLSENPTITSNDVYIDSVSVIWAKTFSDAVALDGIDAGQSEDVIIKIQSNDFTLDMLPENGLNLTITISMEWIEADGSRKELSATGAEVFVGDEMFNIISADESSVMMFAKYNVGFDYKQSQEEQGVMFTALGNNDWNYTSGNREIDIQTYSTDAKLYVNNYVSYLQSLTGDNTITGDLITLTQLGNLGCTVNAYATSALGGYSCAKSTYSNWLVNGQEWWTRSAFAKTSDGVWGVTASGTVEVSECYVGSFGVRPIIVISKDTLLNMFAK